MHIDNVEALKSWLTKSLEPICDADPASLAKYVVALVKKDKAEKDLKESCTEQLDVFLQSKTKEFVEELFNVLKSKDYLTGFVNNENVKPAAQDSKSSLLSDVVKAEGKKENSDSKKSKVSEKSRDVKKEEKARSQSRSPSPRDRRRDYDDRRRRLEERRPLDDRRPLRRRSRSYSPRRSPRRRFRSRSRSPRDRGRSWSRSRSRSRPRSWSRSNSRSRSWSRERKGKRQPDSRGSTPTLDNGRYGNSAISVIPTVGGGMYSTAGSDRYPVESTSSFSGTARPRCKDYDEKGFCMKGDLCPFDHGLDPVIVDTDVSVPPPYQPGGPPPPPPTNGAPRLPGPGFVSGYGPPIPPHMANRPPPPRPEHFEPYNPEAPAISGGPPPGAPPFWHGPPSMAGAGRPGMPPFMSSQQPHLPPQIRQRDHLITIKQQEEETPIVPPGTESPSQEKVLPQEQIKIEVNSGNSTSERMVIAPKRPYGGTGRGYINPNYQNNKYGPSAAKKPFDYNRIGGYRKPDETITQLEVRKIPKEFNNIAKINEHFSKFGSLINIQVNYEGDPEAALVQFSSNAEALACYRSSEPLFNNRFVKVFWHRNKTEEEKAADGAKAEETRSIKDRLGPPVIPDRAKLSLDNTKPKEEAEPVKEKPIIPPASKLSLNNLVTTKAQENVAPKEKAVIYTSSVGNITKTLYNPEAIRAKAALRSPTAVGTAGFVSKIEAIKKQEELKKEALKKKAQIQKQKQELLKKQLEQQKMLIGRLEKNKDSMKPEEKSKIMETLKALSTSIDKIKGEVFPKKPAPPKSFTPAAPVLPQLTPDEARKEILDTELELFNKQHTGEDTTELKKKLAELTKQAAAMGLLGRGKGRGTVVRGRATKWVAKGFQQPGRGRGVPGALPPGGSRSLDNRPKQLEVTGFSPEENEDLMEHFSQHCQVDKIEHSDDEKSAIVNFKTRQDAEKALIKCSKFKEKTLVMRWHTGPRVQIGLNASSDESFGAETEDADDEGGVAEDELDEEALLAGDDDEDDDEESRSWRR